MSTDQKVEAPALPDARRLDPHLRDRAERERFADLYCAVADADYDDTPRYLRRPK